MSVAQQYSVETAITLLNKINERSDQMCDLVQLLIISADDSEKNQQTILKELGDIKETTEEINLKIDLVLEKLTRLELEFCEVKKENRDIEEKIKLMTMKLSKVDDVVQVEELEDYYALSQSLYDNWEDFDQLTRQFIPLAEFLYSKLQKYDKPDYSPVVLELCRAIENEFLLKIFKRYTMDLVARKKESLDKFFVEDKCNLNDKTGPFVRAVLRAAKTKKPVYTLGQMNTILSFMKDDYIVEKSPLLKDFKKYLQDNTETQLLLNEEYICKINEIVNKYRNPSAHPELMTVEKANECRKIMPDRLDYLMECIIA